MSAKISRQRWWTVVLWGLVTAALLLAASNQGSSRAAPAAVPHVQEDEYSIEPVSHFGGRVNAGAVQGNYAYLGQVGYLTVLDISGPQPRQVAYLELPGTPLDLFATDNYAYVYMDFDAGFHIVDISDPLAPSLVGSCDLPGDWYGGVHVAGNYAYVAANRDGLKVVDVSDPSSPQVVGSLDLWGNVVDVFVSGNYAYVSGSVLRVIDITDPTNPVEVGVSYSGWGESLFVVGDYAYLALERLDLDTWGLGVVDVSDPQNPSRVGFLETKVGTEVKESRKVFMQGDYAYIACVSTVEGSGTWLFVADVSDPANPTEAGKLEVTAKSWTAPGSLHVVYPYAYVTVRLAAEGFQVVDISDPTNPTPRAKYEAPRDVLWLHASDDYLYVASDERLWLYDISALEEPTLVSSYAEWPDLRRIFVQGDYLYALTWDDMRIIDVSDPDNLTEVSSYQPVRGRPGELYVSGGYTYLVVGEGGDKLEIVNISDPGNPQRVGGLDLPGAGFDIFVTAGSTMAYIAYYAGDADKGLQIVDVSDPSAPTLLGAAQTAGMPLSLWVPEGIAYVGSNTGEGPDVQWHLEAFDVSDPYNPTLLDEVSGSGEIWDVEVRDEVILIGIRGGSVGVLAWLKGRFEFEGWCDSPATVQMTTPPLVETTPGGTREGGVYTNEGWGYVDDKQKGKYISGDKGVVVQILRVPPPPPPTPTPTPTVTPTNTSTPTAVGCCQIYANECRIITEEECSNFGGAFYPGFICWQGRECLPGTPTPTPTPTFTPTPTPTPKCRVRGEVMPPEARESCWVKPVEQGCQCGQEKVTFTAPQRCPGWQFDRWVPSKVLTCPEEGSATTRAWFVPVPSVRLVSQYKKYFLKDISFKNCYKAIVDWNGPPGYVDFWKNKHHQRKSAPPYEVCYDMGYDFKADLWGGRNVLKAVAVNGYGVKSDPAFLRPMVFPLPFWVRLLQGPWGISPLGRYILYLSEIRHPSPPFKGLVTFPSWLPWFGGKQLGLKEAQARVGLKAKSDGSGSGKVYGQTALTIFGREVVGTFWGRGKVQLRPGLGLHLTRADLSLGIRGNIKSPKIGISKIFPALSAAENWWFVGKLIRWLNNRLFVQLQAVPRLYATFGFQDVDGQLKWAPGEATGSIKCFAFLTLELWEKLKASLYGGGKPKLTIQVPAAPSYLKEVALRLFFGLRLNIYDWEVRFEEGFKCWYPPGDCAEGLAQALTALREANWQLVPRDYVTEGYAMFVANRSAFRLRQKLTRPQTTEETEIVHNVFPLAEPALALRDDGQQLLLWVHDDPAKPNGQGKEILFTHWDGANWSPPVGITDDNYEDFTPQVAFDGNGQAIAIWEHSNSVQPISPTLDITFTQSMEIAYSVWDGTNWSAPALLTNNSLMDYGPRLARSRDGKVMALWRTNSGETLVGDEANPDTFHYAIWDGTAWSTPAIALADLTGVLGVSLAYHGPQAVIVLSRDTDGDLSTMEDSELFYAEWDGANWSALAQLTDDEMADSAPRVVYDGAGQVNVVWLKGEELVHLAGGWAGTPAPLWPEGSKSFANYMLTTDPDGNLALIYQGLSEDGADIYYTIYDETNGLWGLEQRLTEDLPLEDYLAPAFGADGTLWIAYTKVETLFEDKEVVIEGEPIVIGDVPVPGRSDLYLLRHILLPDLAIYSDDIALSVPNPAPGETVTISATVHSAGDLAVADGKVQFYDGFPGLGGVQIGDTQALLSPLRAGMTDTVSVEWTVPITPQSHDVYVLVDPFIEIFESDEMNNLAYITTILPDLLVSDLYVDHVSPQMVWITATVANSGTVPASDITVEWYQDAITGTLLGTALVGEIEAGSSAEVGMTWNVSPADAGEHLVYAVVDPENTITESDETNNEDLAAADVLPDLTLRGSYVEVEINARPPDPLPITLVLSNEGVAEARDVRVRVVQGDPFAQAGPALYEIIVPALEAGGSVILTADISIPGWENVYAIADPEWAISEIYEGNNVALLVEFPPHIFLPLMVRR